MNYLKDFKALSTFATFLIISLPSFSQSSFPFKKIQYAEYKTGKDNKPEILFYATIDKAGFVKMQDKRYPAHKNYTYQLSDSMLEAYSIFFNGAKKLKSEIVVEHLNSGSHYAGNYKFLYVFYSNGKKDSLSYIAPFVSEEFNDLISYVGGLIFSEQIKQIENSQAIDKSFLRSLLMSHRKNKNLPKIEQPPAQVPF